MQPIFKRRFTYCACMPRILGSGVFFCPEKEKEKTMQNLMNELSTNLLFVLQFLGIVVALFLAAYVVEKWEKRRSGSTERILVTRKIAMIGMFSAIAAILMIFEIPLPFLAPNFYKIDLSEIPVLVAAFAFGPVAGVLVEFIKIVLNLLMDSTTTAFVGELANFSVGCSFVLPASIIYTFKKSKKQALLGCVVGTLCITAFGSAFNAVYLLPKFAELFGMPLDAIVEMGTAINPAIQSVSSFVFFAVAPINLIKGTVVSIITILVYKKLSIMVKH